MGKGRLEGKSVPSWGGEFLGSFKMQIGVDVVVRCG